MGAEDDRSAYAAQVAELVASRARIAARADDQTRRVQRELHRGAQQRVVHAVILLKLARAAIGAASPAAGLVEEALANAEGASRELREVIRGLLPQSLVHGGLQPGLRSLVHDLPVDVALRVSTPRLSRQVETTAYGVVAELLAFAVDRARAERMEVGVELVGGVLAVEVRYGGCRPGVEEPADGLTAVGDRVHAAGGTLRVIGQAGAETVIRARLPTGADDPSSAGGAEPDA